MLVAAACFLSGSLGLAAALGMPALFALRVVQAVGYVGFTTAATALVVAVVAPEERGQRVALFGVGANLAISLSPAAIGALLLVLPVEAGLVAAAALGALAALLAVRVPARSTLAPTGRSALEWAIPRRLWLPMLAAALLGAGFAAFFQFAPILADRRGVASGLLYAAYGACIIVTRLVGGRLLDRLTIGWVVGLAAVLMALGHTLIASSAGLAGSALGTLAPLLVAAGLVAAGGGLFHPGLIAHCAALLPTAPGRASAAFYVAFDLGIGIGSWLFGVLLQVADVPGMYWAAAALSAAALLLAPLLSRPPQGGVSWRRGAGRRCFGGRSTRRACGGSG